jgi:hypothetical protein
VIKVFVEDVTVLKALAKNPPAVVATLDVFEFDVFEFDVFSLSVLPPAPLFSTGVFPPSLNSKKCGFLMTEHECNLTSKDGKSMTSLT